jgi:hypothetical protein
VAEHPNLSSSAKDNILLTIAQSGMGDNMRERSLKKAQKKRTQF